MALARLDVPGLALYNGSIAPGRFRGRDITIQDVFEAIGAAAAGTMSNADVHEMESAACPGAGACGGQFTANTMATVLEFLGISPGGLNDVPAHRPREGRGGVRGGADRDAARPRGHPSVAGDHARRDRERDRVRRRDRRLDERRAAPARDREGARDRARARGLRPDRRADAGGRGHQAGAAASSRPISTPRAASRSSRASC